ncbi:MAG: hypothetical protein KDA95_12395, partial [Acidimicrobiales bacterium]|nr:hypothetical protein [Acidimicrobiales bacterium]
ASGRAAGEAEVAAGEAAAGDAEGAAGDAGGAPGEGAAGGGGSGVPEPDSDDDVSVMSERYSLGPRSSIESFRRWHSRAAVANRVIARVALALAMSEC